MTLSHKLLVMFFLSISLQAPSILAHAQQHITEQQAEREETQLSRTQQCLVAGAIALPVVIAAYCMYSNWSDYRVLDKAEEYILSSGNAASVKFAKLID